MATTYKEALNRPLQILLIVLFLITTIYFLSSSTSAHLPSLIPSGLFMVFLPAFWLFWDSRPFLFGPWLLPWYAVRSLRRLQLSRETGLGALKNDFCANCEGILLASPLLNGTDVNFGLTPSTEWYDFRIQANYNADANTGPIPACPLCTILLDSVKIVSTRGKTGTASAILISPLQLKIWQPEEEEGSTYLRLYSSDVPVSTAFKIQEGRLSHCTRVKNRMVTTLSEESMKTSRCWISRCLDKHEKCRRNSQFLPTRLVHISRDGKTAKLLSTSDAVRCEKYMAASHAWGEGVPFQLTLDNHSALVEGFEVSALPPTFVDLFTIALEIGIPYVWIDSLCIIQDSSEDMCTEIATMANIYESATITIAATASKNSNEGCRRWRDDYLYTECVLLISTPEISERFYNPQCLYISPEMWDRREDMEFNFHTKVDTAPLNQRAWVLQEKLLSPRILHCSDGLLLFECNTMRATDIYPPGVEYDKEETIHNNSRMKTPPITHTRDSPRIILHSEVATLVTDMKSRSVDSGVYRKEQVDRIARRINNMARIGIFGTPDEIAKLEKITRRLPKSIQNRVIQGWKSLAYQYSCLLENEARKAEFCITASTVGSRGALEKLYSFDGKSETLTESMKLDLHRRAYELVTEYSRRGITNRSDRLLAFSGLTKRIHDRSGMEYCAGLWRPTLAYDLLWMRSPDSEPVKKPEEPSFAPSWSWARSAGKVESALVRTGIATQKLLDPSKLSKVHITIEEVTLMMGNQRAYGHETMIDGGRITLRGQVKRVSLSEFRQYFLDFTPDGRNVEYFCLLGVSNTKRGSKEGTWSGLLLQRSSDTPEKCYERCGLVIVEGECKWRTDRKWNQEKLTLI